jgi:hypothetical protein
LYGLLSLALMAAARTFVAPSGVQRSPGGLKTDFAAGTYNKQER